MHNAMILVMYVIVLHPLDVLRIAIVNQDLQDPEDKIVMTKTSRPPTLWRTLEMMRGDVRVVIRDAQRYVYRYMHHYEGTCMCVHAYMVYYGIPCMRTTCTRCNALRYATRCIVCIDWRCMLCRPHHLVILGSR